MHSLHSVTRLFTLILAVSTVRAEVLDSDAPPNPATFPKLIERTWLSFDKVRFYKPARDDMNYSSKFSTFNLSPLIVENYEPADQVGLFRINTPYIRSPGKSAATVYYAKNPEDRGPKFEPEVYLWFYEGWGESDLAATVQIWLMRGVRIVLDADGQPILWEALTNEPGPRVFFVSRSWEEAAKAQFGEPLPHRNFSIEKSIEDSPEVVVARVIDDGPMPMGPYVYIDASPLREVTTVLCRCMASQFDEAIETIEYQLKPIETIHPDWLREQGRVDLDQLLDPCPLEKLFRLPKD